MPWPRRSSLLLAAVASIAPLIYPLWLGLSARRRRPPAAPEPSRWPGLSVVVAAYREEAVIAAKVADVRANGYPGDVEVIVVADDPETAAAAEGGADLVLPAAGRRGKAEAVNEGVAAAGGEIVVITDADARLEPGSLAALARWFDDPLVGAVTGEKRVLGANQGLYWRFESWIKRQQSRRGGTIGLVGELSAFRRQPFRPLPSDTAVDDLWLGLDLIDGGLVIRYEPDAVAVERQDGSLAREWQRRTRTQAGLLDLLWRRRRELAPGASPATPDLWGHKLMRSLAGPSAHAALVAQASCAARTSRAARVFALAHLAGAAALARQAGGAKLSAPERAAAQVLFMQATALGAIARYARGGLGGAWPKERRDPGAAVVFGPASR